jgi:hypothetical protein
VSTPSKYLNVDWTALLTVDCTTAAALFVPHPGHSDTKIQIRGYTIPFTGTQQTFADLIDFLRRQLLKYVFPEKERPSDIDWALARNKFGDNDPQSDGKLGELLLYVLVEAFLRTPLMAYKLKDLGNPNDQVKGADGVFVGEYQGQPALLIGESKIHQTVASAIKSTLESLHRFHNNAGPYATELMIARKYPAERGLSKDAVTSVHAIMNRDVGILVHPVFVSYDLAQIAQISQSTLDADSAEAALRKQLATEVLEWQTRIAGLKGDYPKPFQVFLDFFFLPVEDSLQLRKHFYELLHGHPFTPPAPNGSATKTKRKGRAPRKPGGG